MSLSALPTFGQGGIHPPSHKGLTSEKGIDVLPFPDEVWLPLQQHIGEPATPIVKKGERVVRGQKIADGGKTGSPIHATITGKVKPVDKRPHPTLVSADSFIIAGSGEDEELPFPEDPGWRELPREEALRRIQEAGIVGLGGAAFPTYRKLTPPPGSRLDTLVVNGAECEPYLTSDYRQMLARPLEIVEGSLAMARLVGVRSVVLGVEDDKLPAVKALEDAAKEARTDGIALRVATVQVRYPQGAERQLVTALLGRTIPPRALPSAVGAIVQNVATAAAVYDALRFQKPLLDRVVTVSGDGVVSPRNLRVPVGTLLAELVDACGGVTADATRLIAGGPMMGRALPRLDLPVIKGLNGLVVLKGKSPFDEGYGPCIRCARCVDACPLGLEPDQVSIRVERSRTLETEMYGAIDCYECGCCTYVCPSGRPLLQFMQVAKSALRRAAVLLPSRT